MKDRERDGETERERGDWGLLSISVLRGCVYTAVHNYDSHDHNYRIAELSSAQNIHVNFHSQKPYLDDCFSVCLRKKSTWYINIKVIDFIS